MSRLLLSILTMATLLLAVNLVRASDTNNLDQITVLVPALEGPNSLGRNVGTLLSLQLAQTMRSKPWAEGVVGDVFGEGYVRYTPEVLVESTHKAAIDAAGARNVRAQLVVWGRTLKYGKDIVADVNVTLPRYQPNSFLDCSSTDLLKCDYRERNMEIWKIPIGDGELAVDVPRRGFSISTIVLDPVVVDEYAAATGLPIWSSLDGGKILGATGSNIGFLQFNSELPGSPALVRSEDIEGYVLLPKLSNETSEFADTVGGILQYFRGDWDKTVDSFTRVLENPKTRTPLRVDALLYRGVAKERSGTSGRGDFTEAAELAPYDHRVVRYQVMAELASKADKCTVESLMSAKSFLFSPDDAWFQEINGWLESD